MKFMLTRLLVCMGALAGCFSPPSSAAPVSGVTVTGLQLVSTVRIDRTRYDYTYRLVVRNDSGTWLGEPRATGTSTGSKTILTDAQAAFPDLAIGASATSLDTITIRQDRSFPFATVNWAFDAFVPVRAEIQPAATLLTPGASGTLRGVLVDAAGNRLTGRSFTFAAQDPDLATVDSAGVVKAGATMGVARIRASFGSITTGDSLITIAVPANGVTLISDADIVGGPYELDPDAEPSLENPYEVIVRGGLDLESGDKVLNTGLSPVAGRVEFVVVENGNQRLRLVMVPLPELLTRYAFKRSFDLAEDFEILADILEEYDVAVEGNTYTFTGKEPQPVGAAQLLSASSRARSTESLSDATTTAVPVTGPQGTVRETPKCSTKFEGTNPLTPVPISLSSTPVVKLTLDGRFDIDIDETGIKTYKVVATPKVEFKESVKVESTFTGSVECKTVLGEKKIPAPGWARFVIGAKISHGVGVKLSGTLTVLNWQAGFDSQIGGGPQGEFSAGMTCGAAEGSDCDGFLETGNLLAGARFEPNVQTPEFETKLEADLTGYYFAKLGAGNPFLETLGIDVFTAKPGLSLAGGFAVPAVQAANSDFASDYKLAFKASFDPETKIAEFFKLLGIQSKSPLSLKFSYPLAESPKGTFSLDKSLYVTGDPIKVDISLDPQTLAFTPLLPYNVDRIEVRRVTGGFTSEVIGTLVPTPGQTTLSGEFTAPALLTASEIFAFVVTKALPLEILGLEVARTTTGVAASGGVFTNALSSTPGTALLLKLRTATGQVVTSNTPVTISGPVGSGWNGGNDLVVSYPANLKRQFYTLNPAPMSGTYRARATIGGVLRETTFTIDAARSLAPTTNVIAQKKSSTSVEASWDPLDGAQSYLARVFDRATSVIVPPTVFTFDSAATLQNLSPALTESGDYALQVFGFTADMTAADPVLPSQFDVSFNRTLLGTSIAVSPQGRKVLPEQKVGFSAAVRGLADTRVTWSASGGVIGSDGVWTAPSPSVTSVYTVTARSVAAPDVSGSAQVTVVVPEDCTLDQAAELLRGDWMITSFAPLAGFLNCSAHPPFAQFGQSGTFTLPGAAGQTAIVKVGDRVLSSTGPVTYSCLNVLTSATGAQSQILSNSVIVDQLGRMEMFGTISLKDNQVPNLQGCTGLFRATK